MTNFLLAAIIFPENGNFVQKIVYAILEWIMGWGWVNYGFAIIFFTIFIKLIMLPLDFFNRYSMKKKQAALQRVAPEEKILRETYADDPMALIRARSELYRRQGVNQGGFITLLNLFITLAVFWSVFSGLRTVANYNINNQVNALQGVYNQYRGTDELDGKLDETYNELNVSFMWVKNMWRPDTWSSEIMTYKDYEKAIVKIGTPIDETEYNAIFESIKKKHNGWGGWHWNGMLLLVALSGVVTYLSTWLSMTVNKKNVPQKTAAPKAEPIITYSLRDAKRQSGGGQPEIDPAQINKIMLIIMPIMMVSFAFTSTAAMSIYIISSSVVSTILTLSLGFAVDAIIKRQKPKTAKADFDPTVINPHAKYFKNKGVK
jgi:YidC/Oxa1 family membrane protein insertase